MNELTIRLTGGGRVVALHDGLSITTDQDDSYPSPFELFVASIGTCAGFYVAAYCNARGLPLEGIELRQRNETDARGAHIERVHVEIAFPPSFPAEHREGALRAVRACKVKQHLERPPEIVVGLR